MAEDRDGVVEIEGVIQPAGDPRWVVADITFAVDGSAPVQRRLRAPFVVRTAHGAVEVDATRASLVDGPRFRRRGRWQDLGRSEVGSIADGFAPGPHVEVTAEGVAFRAGDRVRVRGTVAETASSEHGYRDAVTQRVRKLAAVAIGSPTNSPSRGATHDRVRLFAAMGLLLSLGLALLPFFVPPPVALGDACMRGAWLAWALVTGWHSLERAIGHTHVMPSGRSHHLLPDFRTVEPGARARAAEFPATLFGALVFVLVLAPHYLTVAADLFRGEHGRVADASSLNMIYAAAAGALATGLVVLEWRRSRRARRCAWALLRAPLRHGLEGGWRAVEGWAPSSGGMAAREVEIVFVSTGVGRTSRVQAELHEGQAEDRLGIGAPAGTVDVQLAGATVATLTSESKPSHREGAPGLTLQFLVPGGASVLVAGRFDEGSSRLRAHGPESLLLFAGSPGGKARRQLAARSLAHTASWAMLVVGVLYAVLASLTVG